MGLHKGQLNSGSFKKGNKSHFGIKHNEESKKKMSSSAKKRGFNGFGFKKGQPRHPNWIKAMNKMRGENCYNWKGGITPLNKLIRASFKYRQWISDIFTRDDFTCQICNKRGCYLEAHHIKEFNKIIAENNIKTFDDAMNCEELWNINNGMTLCFKCHQPTKNGRKTK